MTRACHTPMRMATGEAFSDAELDDMLDRLTRRFERAKKKTPSLDDKAAMAEAAGQLTREQLMTALIDQRLEAAAEAAKKARRAQLDAMPASLGESDRLRAFSVGSEKQGFATSLSVDARGRALAEELLGDLTLGLKKIEGVVDQLSNFFGVGDRDFERKVAREIHLATGGTAAQATGDERAVAAARVIAEQIEKGRLKQNEAGAWIGKLEGYVARQSHDRLKVSGGFWRELRAAAANKKLDLSAASLAASKKAFGQWRDFIRPRLHEATFEGVDPWDLGDVAEAKALHAQGVISSADDLEERFLYRVWSDIVTGASEVITGGDVGEFKPAPGKARAVSKSRVLHFTGPDAWMDYHERFGRGSLMGAVVSDLERAGKNTALMQAWGPSPQTAFENEVARLTEDARGRGATGEINKLHSVLRKAEFGELTGENNRADNLRLALIGRAFRLDQTLSKLGGMVLSAIGSDQALAAQAFKRAGARFLDGYSSAFAGVLRMQGEDQKLAADLVDAGARSFTSHLAGRFMGSDGPLGWGAWASRLFYRVNGFEFVADGHRQGVAAMIAAHLGQQAQHAHGALNIGTREMLERFGIDAAAWDQLRKGAVKLGDGRSYLTFDGLDKVHPDTALRFRAMVTNFLDDTLTEPRARERVGLTMGQKPGTLLGEAIRVFTQFWSFNQAAIGRHLAPAARGYAGQKPAALLAHLIAATTLGGFVSLQAKQIARGMTPRPLVDENGHVDAKIWLAAMLQGGGLGIYGDFLFGEANRNGLGFSVGSIAGPGVSELESLVQIVRASISGDERDLPADLFKVAARNTPFVNLWYTRLALDYLVLWRIQEALSPGYLDRYQRRVEDQQHSHFLISPSEAVR